MPTSLPTEPIDPALTGAGAGDILVVDDNPNNLLAIEAALGDLAGSLVKVRAGEDALRALLRQDFALILLDIQMPTMDGFETARLVRTRGRSRHTPIIFITAYGQDQEGILRGYELGAVDFLFKPIVPEVLRAKVTVFVELRRRAAELARQAELLREHERREHERQLGAERQRWEAELLRRENRELEENDRRKNEFLAMLAHELRTPLSPVVMGLDLLRQSSDGATLSAGQEQVVGAMERQLHHLTRLVDDLLEVSRITRGSIELRRRPLSLQEPVQQAVQMCRADIERREHTLTVELPEAPIWVEVDPVRLTQVFCNLLTNAARYTDPGGTIAIRCTRTGDSVSITVRDTGRGISAEFLERIFDMFVQGEGSGGLGLGLALVRRLVEMHGGRVIATSEGPGRGSTFEVRLPVLAEAAVPAEVGTVGDRSEITGETPSEPLPAATAPRRVVIVEDHEDIRELLAEALRRRGHQVLTSMRGEDGARVIQEARPEVALIDIGLPDIDGLEVARRARASVGDATRLVAMTGFGQTSVKQRALAAGFDEFLVKPIQVGTIERLLGGGSVRQRRASSQTSSAPSLAASSTARSRVLVVEDDEDTSSVLRAALTREGYDVEVAREGQDAVDKTRSWRPQVILCDLTLPGPLSGLDVARQLRGDEVRAALRLIAVTGHSRPEDRRAATEAGFDDYLTKPLTLAAVKTAVAQSIAHLALPRIGPGGTVGEPDRDKS